MNIEVSKRDSVFCELKNYCHLASKNAYMEVTEWSNGEGFDITLSNTRGQERISLTYGEWDAIQAVVAYKE